MTAVPAEQAISRIVAALEAVRMPAQPEEYDIHAAIAEALAAAGLPCEHEHRLGRGRRIDFVSGRVGIEVKKGRPPALELTAQLRRYAEAPELDGLVVVTQRATPIPDVLLGKPVRQITLDRLWGVALP